MSKLRSTDYTLHSDSLLTRHELAVLQAGWGDDATFTVVDYFTHKPASAKRIVAWEKEDAEILSTK